MYTRSSFELRDSRRQNEDRGPCCAQARNVALVHRATEQGIRYLDHREPAGFRPAGDSCRQPLAFVPGRRVSSAFRILGYASSTIHGAETQAASKACRYPPAPTCTECEADPSKGQHDNLRWGPLRCWFTSCDVQPAAGSATVGRDTEVECEEGAADRTARPAQPRNRELKDAPQFNPQTYPQFWGYCRFVTGRTDSGLAWEM
jgi:hypothetical protein